MSAARVKLAINYAFIIGKYWLDNGVGRFLWRTWEKAIQVEK